MKPPGDRRSVSRSATRALDLLELFGALRRPLRAVEIAHALELHPSTTNQLLKTMLESAHLSFQATTKTYFLSPRLASFSAWMTQTFGAGERLRDVIRELHVSTGQLVTVMTPNDTFMQLVDFFGPPHEDETTTRGLRISIFGSVTGTAFLSTLEDKDIMRLADRARVDPAEVPAILATVQAVRQDGFFCAAAPGRRLWSLAMPLPAAAAPVPLVMGMSGTQSEIQSHMPELWEKLQGVVAALTPPSGQ